MAKIEKTGIKSKKRPPQKLKRGGPKTGVKPSTKSPKYL